MTIEIDLPPLPEPNGSYTNPYDGDDLENYARAVAEHSVAARDAEIERLKVVAHGFVDEIAARDAEIEALRGEVAAQRTRADAMVREAIKHEARADRLAEVLRGVTATAITVLYATHPEETLAEFSTAELKQIVDASKKLWAQRVERIYRRAWDAVLRDHDQEADNG